MLYKLSILIALTLVGCSQPVKRTESMTQPQASVISVFNPGQCPPLPRPLDGMALDSVQLYSPAYRQRPVLGQSVNRRGRHLSRRNVVAQHHS